MSLDGLINKFKSEFEHIREERRLAEQHNVQTKIEEKPAEPEKPAEEKPADKPAEEKPAAEVPAPEGEAPKE